MLSGFTIITPIRVRISNSFPDCNALVAVRAFLGGNYMQQTLEHLTVLTGLSEQDSLILKECAPVAQAWAQEIVTLFYDTLFGYAPTAQVFQPSERPARKVTVHNWYAEILTGEFTPDFWKRQWIVGMVHIPRHISNAFMFGMMSRVQQAFLTKCMENFEPDRAVQVYASFKRVTDVIAGLIGEGYFLNYVSAVENMAGLRPMLVERMLQVQVRDRIAQARTGELTSHVKENR